MFAAATPSSCASPPVGASVPTSQALCEALALPRLWGVPLGFLALATSLRAHRYSGAPKPGGGAGPEKGAVGSQSFCERHLELAASQRIFT